MLYITIIVLASLIYYAYKYKLEQNALKVALTVENKYLKEELERLKNTSLDKR